MCGSMGPLMDCNPQPSCKYVAVSVANNDTILQLVLLQCCTSTVTIITTITKNYLFAVLQSTPRILKIVYFTLLPEVIKLHKLKAPPLFAHCHKNVIVQ